MKHSKKVFLAGWIGAALFLTVPALADSKTVNVSCSVAEQLEISSFRPASVAEDTPLRAQSNLGPDFRLSQEIRHTPSGKIKVYSLFAL